MIALFLPTEDDSTQLVIGFTVEDLAMLTAGALAGPYDLTGIFKMGKPLPDRISLLFGRDSEHIMDRLRERIPNLDERLVPLDTEEIA